VHRKGVDPANTGDSDMATLREIIAELGEEWLDAELSVRVYDGHRNAEYSNVEAHYSNFFRNYGRPEGKDRFLRVEVGLEQHRLVKERK
jgi:hypothetical protein